MTFSTRTISELSECSETGQKLYFTDLARNRFNDSFRLHFEFRAMI